MQFSDVLNAIIKGQKGNAAHKAHATRKLNIYLDQQESLGKNRVRVNAAVKAYVTRNQNGPN